MGRATRCSVRISYVGQLLIPKILGQPNVPESWRNGGGGGGGPIVKNKTFFWFAGEKYVDNQPQANSFLVPTDAEEARRLLGADAQRRAVLHQGSVVDRVPCSNTTGGAGCFPGNLIPANRLNPVGQQARELHAAG